MKEYVKPEIEVVFYNEKDIVMVSSATKQTDFNEKNYSSIHF